MHALKRVARSVLPLVMSREMLRKFEDVHSQNFEPAQDAILRVYFDHECNITAITQYLDQPGFHSAKQLLSQCVFADSASDRRQLWNSLYNANYSNGYYVYVFACPKPQVRGVPYCKANEEAAGDCHICLGPVEQGHLRITLSCGHVFHALCYLSWKNDDSCSNLQTFLAGDERLCVFGCPNR